NCLFRALGDQLEGHSRNHLRHRQETVDYMIKQRGDFEPFVEDDVPFEKHVTNLAKPGTFAGNDAIVAFARNHQVNVVIHQLNAPLWQGRNKTSIRGADKNNVRELHIAYRYGEHYDSVRRINDDSEAPAYLQMEMLCKNDSTKEEEVKPQRGDSEDEIEVEMEGSVQKVCNATGCSAMLSFSRGQDIDLVSRIREVKDYSIESAIFAIFQVDEMERISKYMEIVTWCFRRTLCDVSIHCKQAVQRGQTGSRIFGNRSLHEGETENKEGQARSDEENRASRNPKVSKKQKKEQQRLEKKKRQEERHRQKVLANKSNCTNNSRRETDSTNQVTLVKAMAALNI
ncbi:OTU domain-containing protein 3, partial [Antrostomus carolinensis]